MKHRNYFFYIGILMILSVNAILVPTFFATKINPNSTYQSSKSTESIVYNRSTEYQVEQITGGSYHTGAVVQDSVGQDHIFTWGDNTYGQLGVGNTETTIGEPQDISVNFPELQAGGSVKYLEMGWNNSAAVITDIYGYDHIYFWGSNEFGQIGNQKGGKNEQENLPVDITSDFSDYLIDQKGQVTDLAIGENFSALTIEDTSGYEHLYTFGANDAGQSGIGFIDNEVQFYSSPNDITDSVLDDNEEKVLANPDNSILELEAGQSHLGLLVDNTEQDQNQLFMWGSNYTKQISWNLGATVSAPTYIPFSSEIKEKNSEITDIALSNQTTAVISSNSSFHNQSVYTWGSATNGALGNGENSGQEDITDISSNNDIFTKGENFEQLVAGENSFFLLSTDNSNDQHLYAWGENTTDNLGITNRPFYSNIQEVTDSVLNKNETISVISTESDSTILLIDDRQNDQYLKMWGGNQQHQINSVDQEVISPKDPYILNFFPLYKEDSFTINSSDPYSFDFSLEIDDPYNLFVPQTLQMLSQEEQQKSSYVPLSIEYLDDDPSDSVYNYTATNLESGEQYTHFLIDYGYGYQPLGWDQQIITESDEPIMQSVSLQEESISKNSFEFNLLLSDPYQQFDPLVNTVQLVSVDGETYDATYIQTTEDGYQYQVSGLKRGEEYDFTEINFGYGYQDMESSNMHVIMLNFHYLKYIFLFWLILFIAVIIFTIYNNLLKRNGIKIKIITPEEEEININ